MATSRLYNPDCLPHICIVIANKRHSQYPFFVGIAKVFK